VKAPYRLGIVGAGFMGSRIGARIAAGDIPRFELCGITDIDVGRARTLAAELGTAAFERFDQLVESGPDAVYIATPDHLHREPCEAAAAGVPFLVEKPLATTMEDAEAIV
jgi:predicted dehydrogenase